VIADRLAPRELLAELRPDVELIDATKLPRGRAADQSGINELLVQHALSGKSVVRFKGGDPFVFGRGFEEAIACAEAGVPFRVVPGITSAVSVPALGGIPVTHRGVAHEFTVASGHLPPGHPDSLVDWEALGRLRGTLVLLMAVQNLAAITAALESAGRDPRTPAAVVQDGSMTSQRVVSGMLTDIAGSAAEAGIRPPAIVVIGDVVGVAQQLPHHDPTDSG
jgi:uroporphyrin-III C-methyltransferase/precorrin-2 dehydrogenase/sirohydrochlorin ferrochelatase